MGWKDLCTIGNQPGSCDGGGRDTFKMFGHFFPKKLEKKYMMSLGFVALLYSAVQYQFSVRSK